MLYFKDDHLGRNVSVVVPVTNLCEDKSLFSVHNATCMGAVISCCDDSQQTYEILQASVTIRFVRTSRNKDSISKKIKPANKVLKEMKWGISID